MPTVGELMTKNVCTIEKDSDAFKASETMVSRGVGSIVIVDKGRPIGIVTERDLLVKVVARKKDPSSTKVAEIMSTPLISIRPRSHVREAAKLMVDYNIRRLVVLENETLVGILSIRDLTRSILLTMASHSQEEAGQEERTTAVSFET